jgi:predicted membrane-bound spermidine synthase
VLLLLFLIFCLSGASALVFETLWFRQAGLAFGNGVWASSLVLASFMGGLALGNGLAARHAGRARRPLRAYALLETVIGGTGLGLVLAWPLLGGSLAPVFRGLVDTPLALNGLRLGLAFALMAVPASAMGATLPILACALRRRVGVFGQTLGFLYGANTLGAVAGAIAGEAVLVRYLGVRGSGLAAACMNAVAALAAAALSARIERSEIPPAASPFSPPPTGRRLLAAAFLCGAAMLSLEVVWFRFLSLFVTNSSVAFALLLAAVLLGIGLGGLAAALWVKADHEAGHYLRPILLMAGALTVTGYAGFGGLGGLEGQSGRGVRILSLALHLTFPVCLLSGISFTLLGHRAHPEGGSEGHTVGRLALANTLGALVGSVAGGFVLLPVLGTERSILALALAYAAAAALVPGSAAPPRARLAALLALGVLAVSLASFPFGLMARRYLAVVAQRFASHGDRAIGVREGLTETLIYMQRDRPFSPPVFRLVTNGFSMSATGIGGERYMSLYAWWPAAVHPRLREALLISYGCGVTARALVQVPGIERIDVVDISRDILDASRIVHPRGANPLDDARVSVHVEDGRQYLLTTERRYDLITGEPPPPRLAGVVNLYTREYFHLVRARLLPGGIVTYWLPVDQLMPADTKAVVGAFCEAFPDCSLWSGSGLNWMLVGTNGRSGHGGEGRFVGLWAEPVVGGGLRGIGVERPEQLGALFIDDAAGLRERVGDAPALADDVPYRILTPVGSTVVWREVLPVYRRWADADEARRRFAASRFVADLWPPAVRAGSLAYFEWQGLLDEAMIAQTVWQPPSTVGLTELDAVLTRSALRTLALWLLGTNADEQRAVSELAVRGQRHEELLGLGALASREYESAAASFERVSGAANRQRRAYALALAGRWSQVEELARTDDGTGTEFWAWMRVRFRDGQQ